MIIKIMLIVILLIAIWINIDNFILKRKIANLIGRIEQLSKIADVKCNLPTNELPDEVKINCLQNQLDSLEPLILNQSYQDKDPKDILQ